MTLRSWGRETVPITGPRSRALAAPQAIGKLSLAPGAGCEVMRIWSTRLERVIATDPETATARLSRRAWSRQRSNQQRLQLSKQYNQIATEHNGNSNAAASGCPRWLTFSAPRRLRRRGCGSRIFKSVAMVWQRALEIQDYASC